MKSLEYVVALALSLIMAGLASAEIDPEIYEVMEAGEPIVFDPEAPVVELAEFLDGYVDEEGIYREVFLDADGDICEIRFFADFMEIVWLPVPTDVSFYNEAVSSPPPWCPIFLCGGPVTFYVPHTSYAANEIDYKGACPAGSSSAKYCHEWRIDAAAAGHSAQKGPSGADVATASAWWLLSPDSTDYLYDNEAWYGVLHDQGNAGGSYLMSEDERFSTTDGLMLGADYHLFARDWDFANYPQSGERQLFTWEFWKAGERYEVRLYMRINSLF